MKILTGMFIASLLLIALHLKGEWLLGKLFERGDDTVWGDECKLPTYRYYGERLPNE